MIIWQTRGINGIGESGCDKVLLMSSWDDDDTGNMSDYISHSMIVQHRLKARHEFQLGLRNCHT